jgi:NAD-dependent deacetylase
MESSIRIPDGVAERLACCEVISVLTGAGISAESGIPTFRDKGGLWDQEDPMTLATPSAFREDPEKVWRWYDLRRQAIKKAKPNAGHVAIADLERNYDDYLLTTQNIDGLHRRAGNRKMVELHGNIWRARCVSGDAVITLEECPLEKIPPPCPECGSLLRPDVVWFEEPIPQEEYARACEAAYACDAMLVVGTSALVYPAANIPLVAKYNGAFVIEVNTEKTGISPMIDRTILGSAAQVLPRLVEKVLELRKSKNDHKNECECSKSTADL